MRAFRTGKFVAKERITVLDAPRRFAYEGLGNPQMADYRATIELRETPDGGTRIRWHGTYQARRGMRWFFQWCLRRYMKSMADGLAKNAAAKASGDHRD
jgi:carbon monoxide dehydrogenase subunit G